MLGSESEKTAERLARKSLNEGIYHYCGMRSGKSVPFFERSGKFRVFCLKRARFDDRLDLLLRVPDRALEGILCGRRRAHKAERHRRKIVKKRGFFGVNERNIFVKESDLSTR